MARAPARRRTYSATAPLFAREDLRFSGRPVATRAQVPEVYFRKARDRRVLWDARKVDHFEDLPVKRSVTTPTTAPALPPDAELEQPTPPAEVTLTFPGVATAELDAKITERERQSTTKHKRRS